MARYAIGDIQGCFVTLQALLTRCGFDPASDRLWLVGDLVNRGPDSLAVLRWARDLGDAATVVTGNHELNLLGVAAGVRKLRDRDTFDEVLGAPDRDELLEWVRALPFVHLEDDFVMVHAGFHPAWGPGEAARLGREVNAVLNSPNEREFLAGFYEDDTDRWDYSLQGLLRVQAAARFLTTVRTLHPDGRLSKYNGYKDKAPATLTPWFEVPGRQSVGANVVFGHWGVLGPYRAPGVLCLDSGCASGGCLTAVRLEDGEMFQEPNRESA